MAPKSILFCFTLALLEINFSGAFETDQCDHENITVALGKLQECINVEDGGGDNDFCSTFRSARECVTKNLQECFSADQVERISNETAALEYLKNV